MPKFWELVEESVIVQGITTLLLIGTTAYMVVAGRPIPDGFMQLDMLALGFYFGSKSVVSSRKSVEATVKALTIGGNKHG